MSNLASALLSFEEFLKLANPDADNDKYELHDGAIVLRMPPARPRHLAVQMKLPQLLSFVSDFKLLVVQEFPYRPARNYQFWIADVAVVPESVRKSMMTWSEYEIYSPPLVIEILSPSNTPEKISKQRIVSMSNGTEQFWVVDADQMTVQSTTRNGVTLHQAGDLVELSVAPDGCVAVDEIFS